MQLRAILQSQQAFGKYCNHIGCMIVFYQVKNSICMNKNGLLQCIINSSVLFSDAEMNCFLYLKNGNFL